jgi:hypothetical protein
MPSDVTQFAAALAAMERPRPTVRQQPAARSVGVVGEGPLAVTLACAALAEGHAVSAASAFAPAWAADGFDIQGGRLTGRYRCEAGEPGDVPAVEQAADVRAAAAGADLVVLSCARDRLATYAALLADRLDPGQDVAIVGGGALAAVEFEHAVRARGGRTGPVLQTVVDPYLVRARDGRIEIVAEAQRTPVTASAGTAPVDRTDRLAAALATTVEALSPVESVFADPSPALLAAGAVLAAAAPEAGLASIATEPAVERLTERLDAERRATAEAYGPHSLPDLDAWATLYGAEPLADERALAALPALEGWHAADADPREQARQLVAGSLGPWAALARLAGVAAVTTGACLQLLALVADAEAGEPSLGALGLPATSSKDVVQALTQQASG